jgi:two-component system LytT family response regulator
MPAPIPVAIVDDEPLARHKLRGFLDALPEFRICGEAGDGETAVRLIAETRPRLLCLDIRLPGVSGLDVLRRARPDAAVIFTTAFDRYAVTAFELAAVDYLLKPFSRDRFLAAVDRARAWLALAEGLPPVERMRAVSRSAYLKRLFLRDGDVVLPIRDCDVQHCESSDDAVVVQAAGRRYRLNVTLSDLESRLDPAVFLRIHRRMIVNLDHVTAIVPLAGSRFEVQLRDGAALTVSRQRSRLLRRRGLVGPAR